MVNATDWGPGNGRAQTSTSHVNRVTQVQRHTINHYITAILQQLEAHYNDISSIAISPTPPTLPSLLVNTCTFYTKFYRPQLSC